MADRLSDEIHVKFKTFHSQMVTTVSVIVVLSMQFSQYFLVKLIVRHKSHSFSVDPYC